MSSAQRPTGQIPPKAIVSKRLARGEIHREKWRYRCPHGHTSVRLKSPRNDIPYSCRSCRQLGVGPGDHSHVIDWKHMPSTGIHTNCDRDVVIYDELVDSGGGCDE